MPTPINNSPVFLGWFIFNLKNEPHYSLASPGLASAQHGGNRLSAPLAEARKLAFYAHRTRASPLFDMGKNALQFIQTAVINRYFPFAACTMMELHSGAQFLGKVILQPYYITIL